MEDDNETKKNRYLQLVAQKTDVRSKKPEFRIILDTLQDLSPTTLQDLLDEINIICDCEMFTYNSLHYHINALRGLGAIKQNDVTKEISISSDHITKEIRYLPISSYCVAMLGISTTFLIYSVYTNYMVVQSTTAVLIGTIYIAGQLFGNEFSLQKLKSLYLNTNTVKDNGQNLEKV